MSDSMSIQRAMLEQALRGGGAGATSPERTPGSKNFAETLKGLVEETDDLQKVSEKTLEGFASGEVEDVHQVMVAMNRADLSFRMMLEVRNKLVEAYQEVMRAQV